MDYSVIDRYIDRLIAETTPDAPVWNIENIRHGKKAGWNYIDGCMMKSLYSLYKLTGDKKYLNFVDNFIDYYVFEDGSILGYDQETYNLAETDGGLNLGGICLMAGLGPEDNKRRDGSYEYYISEPKVENDAKGTGPFVMAYTEIRRLKK